MYKLLSLINVNIHVLGKVTGRPTPRSVVICQIESAAVIVKRLNDV